MSQDAQATRMAEEAQANKKESPIANANVQAGEPAKKKGTTTENDGLEANVQPGEGN